MTYSRQIQEATLERFDFYTRKVFDDRMIGRAKFKSFRDEMTRSMIVELQTYVYGKRHPSQHVIRFPKDWLESLKERFAPCWLRDKWPVKYTAIEVSLLEFYPDIEPEIPGKKVAMRFATHYREEIPSW